ncbi:PH domain-containing protein [Halobacteria archaeon AArc-m2/3/4]|uniref:PH domain-containing protein n=1 Tax=Natronoglomus mannanivorans TaxID=2979990 RepID=A0AAP2YWX7_9EURY|nr:PH domain-containing protein [Halobacteria archaeon AArc-xg1-1]MCU4971372.1 PH domain-containing protein [Halobacteria archaeon AArc-m2/3/4]
MERLNPRVRPVWVLLAIVRSGIFGGFVVGGAVAFTRGTDVGIDESLLVWSAVALAVVVLIVRVVIAWLRYSVWRFEVRADSLYIERGVLTRVKTVVPFVRVQHVDSQRGPIERSVGLATVVVYTAGSRSADVAIPGLTPDRAETLREELRQLAIESEGEDAV